MYRLLVTTIFILSSFSFFFTDYVYAKKSLSDATPALTTVSQKTGLTQSSLTDVAGDVVAMIFIASGLIFFVLMVYAGVRWMTARDKEESVEKAKNTMIAAVIGLVILLAAYAVSNFISGSVIGNLGNAPITPNTPPSGEDLRCQTAHPGWSCQSLTSCGQTTRTSCQGDVNYCALNLCPGDNSIVCCLGTTPGGIRSSCTNDSGCNINDGLYCNNGTCAQSTCLYSAESPGCQGTSICAQDGKCYNTNDLKCSTVSGVIGNFCSSSCNFVNGSTVCSAVNQSDTTLCASYCKVENSSCVSDVVSYSLSCNSNFNTCKSIVTNENTQLCQYEKK